MIVADANLIGAYCINATTTAAAKAVFAKDRAWIAPKLWQAEFVSILRKFQRAQLITEQKSESSLLVATSLMRGIDYDNDVRDIAAVCDRTGCSPYDSCYVALAEEKRIKLITTDSGILSNAPHVAMSPEQFLAA